MNMMSKATHTVYHVTGIFEYLSRIWKTHLGFEQYENDQIFIESNVQGNIY